MSSTGADGDSDRFVYIMVSHQVGAARRAVLISLKPFAIYYLLSPHLLAQQHSLRSARPRRVRCTHAIRRRTSQETVLAEHTRHTGTRAHPVHLAYKLLRTKVKPAVDSKHTYSCPPRRTHHFHVLVEQRRVHLCLARADVTKRVAFTLLDKTRREFASRFGSTARGPCRAVVAERARGLRGVSECVVVGCVCGPSPDSSGWPAATRGG